MTNRLIRHRHDLSMAGMLLIAAATILGVALFVWTATLVMGVGHAAGVLPEVEPQTPQGVITTIPPNTIETEREAHVYVRYRDWRRIKNLVANDVRRHGGWAEPQPETSRTVRYYVPSSYVQRLKPLLASSGQKPHSATYQQWGTQTLADADARQPTETVDTAVSITFDAPLADRAATRWAFRSTVAAAAGLFTLALLCGLANLAGQAMSEKRRQNQPDA